MERTDEQYLEYLINHWQLKISEDVLKLLYSELPPKIRGMPFRTLYNHLLYYEELSIRLQ